MSAEAQDLIRGLLHENPKERLGARGAASVKAHRFFAGIDWSTLREQPAPFIPAASELDTSQFEARQHNWPMGEDQFLTEQATPRVSHQAAPEERTKGRHRAGSAPPLSFEASGPGGPIHAPSSAEDIRKMRDLLGKQLRERQVQQSDVFAQFWCIHGQNLHAKNMAILAKIQTEQQQEQEQQQLQQQQQTADAASPSVSDSQWCLRDPINVTVIVPCNRTL